MLRDLFLFFGKIRTVGFEKNANLHKAAFDQLFYKTLYARFAVPWWMTSPLDSIP